MYDGLTYNSYSKCYRVVMGGKHLGLFTDHKEAMNAIWFWLLANSYYYKE